MEKMIAYCGLVCTDCVTYKATQANDMEKKKEIAEQWSKEYKHDFKPEDINCVGCTADGQHIGYCGMCQIRICAQEKSVKNCGWCADYSCSKTDDFFNTVPDAKKVLDEVKGEKS